MDDLISRQAAIDAICKEKNIYDLVCAIKALPSAQPTCDTCEYNSLDWDAEPCDSCTVGGNENHYVPSAQPITCRECKYFMPPHGCGYVDGLVTAQEDGFCSYVERREG